MPRTTRLVAACALLVLTGLLLPVPATADVADTTPPHSYVDNFGYLGQSQVTVDSFVPFGYWIDDESELASYDVRVSRTPMRSIRRAAWTYPSDLQGVRSVPRVPIRRGQIVCVGVRARDTAGNQEAWADGGSACIARPVDDSSRLFTRKGRVEVVRNPKFLGGRARVLHRGATMTMRGIPRYSRVTVVLTTMPDDMRGLMWSYPGCSGCFAFGSEKVRHRQLETYQNRFSRRGALRIQEYNDRTFPFDGVAVIPRWLWR